MLGGFCHKSTVYALLLVRSMSLTPLRQGGMCTCYNPCAISTTSTVLPSCDCLTCICACVLKTYFYSIQHLLREVFQRLTPRACHWHHISHTAASGCAAVPFFAKGNQCPRQCTWPPHLEGLLCSMLDASTQCLHAAILYAMACCHGRGTHLVTRGM